MSVSVGIERWQRPIKAHAEETYDFYAGEPKRSILWILNGDEKEQVEDLDRLAKGLACHECLAVFPYPPALENLAAWKPHLAGFTFPGRDENDVRALVANGLCPTCTAEVGPGMHEVMYRGDVEKDWAS